MRSDAALATFSLRLTTGSLDARKAWINGNSRENRAAADSTIRNHASPQRYGAPAITPGRLNFGFA